MSRLKPASAQVEHEAEQVAAHVIGMRGATPGPRAPITPPDVGDLPGGEPLSPSARAFLEPRFGVDFRRIRIHSDAEAAAAAAAVGARAFTVGSHIILGAEAALGSSGGTRLLAHELTHVVQQRAGGAAPLGIAAAPVAVAATPEEDEARNAVLDVWHVLAGNDRVGTQIAFELWVRQGAITVVRWERVNDGTATTGRPITSEAFARSVAGWMPWFLGNANGYVRLVMQRETGAWVQQSFVAGQPAGQPAAPPEGRSIPMTGVGVSAETFAAASDLASRVMTQLRVSNGGTADVSIDVELDDDRIGAWTPTSYRQSGGEGPNVHAAPPGFTGEIINALRPLTRGMGQRTARLELRGINRGGTTTWHVREARIARPAQPGADEADEIVREYRQTHQRIIREWRAGVRDAAVMAAGFTIEQVALWLIGGAVFRVFGALFRAAAPTLMGFIRGGGGRAGAQYLETMIVRLAPAERAELRALMAKAETSGASSLTALERNQLQGLLTRLESLVSAPLSRLEKDWVRSAMVGRYEAAQGTAAAALRASGRPWQIHHRMPLEYGHLVPGFDLNAGSNLIGLELRVHQGVNAVWTRFRTTAPSGRITPDAVRRVAAIVDRNFRQWYDAVPSTAGLDAAVTTATDAARTEVAAVVRLL